MGPTSKGREGGRERERGGGGRVGEGRDGRVREGKGRRERKGGEQKINPVAFISNTQLKCQMLDLDC